LYQSVRAAFELEFSLYASAAITAQVLEKRGLGGDGAEC
jgi:hypothetical protein